MEMLSTVNVVLPWFMGTRCVSPSCLLVEDTSCSCTRYSMKPLASTKVKGCQVTMMILGFSVERDTSTSAGALAGTGAWVHEQAVTIVQTNSPPPACVKQVIVVLSPQSAGLQGTTDTLYGVCVSAKKKGVNIWPCQLEA